MLVECIPDFALLKAIVNFLSGKVIKHDVGKNLNRQNTLVVRGDESMNISSLPLK